MSRSWSTLCVLAVLASVGSGALVLQARALQPRREAELAGVRLRLEQATWLHEPMDHGERAPLPPGATAPKAGERRLFVELSFFNPLGTSQEFSARELALVSEDGQRWLPVEGSPEGVSLRPAQLLLVPLHYNVPASAGGLRLEWTRGEEHALLLATRPPPSVSSPPQDSRPWPRRAEDLPPGSPVAGAALFQGKFACATCHGNPEQPTSRRLAPSLAGFEKGGATRIPGKSAAQYAYESLLFPGAFIASGCAGGVACARPSLMPAYGESLSPREMADLISYLLAQREAP